MLHHLICSFLYLYKQRFQEKWLQSHDGPNVDWISKKISKLFSSEPVIEMHLIIWYESLLQYAN
jgi:hypothetical protein